MPVRDDLGKRMKIYEAVPKNILMRRTPVAIRIDGKAFHTFTRGMKKPFDDILVRSMQNTMEYLCKNIQGCVFGYTQSDEITLILIDYQTFETSAWFDYEVQKMCSIAASMTTMAFNKYFSAAAEREIGGAWENDDYSNVDYLNVLKKAMDKGAMFDARCFNIPKEEVCNLVYWRQLDAIRNSIQMVGQANFSHKELQSKSCNMIKEMLIDKENTKPWEDYPIYLQRGTACYKANMKYVEEGISRLEWYVDKNMPILKGEDRDYLEKHLILNG